MNEQVYTAAFPFGGCGGGALGFLNASVTMLGTRASFRLTGGVDFDPVACKDFEYLTGVPEACADVDDMTPADFRRAMGDRAPDVIFMSPPCLPATGLVLTPTGPRAISTMRVGDLVMTHLGRYRRVQEVGTEPFRGDMIGVRLHGTVDVQEFTPEHPIWIRRATAPVVDGRQRKRLGEPRFVRAGSLRVGDRVGFPVEQEVEGTARRFIHGLGDPQRLSKGGHNDGARYAKPAHTATLTRIADLRSHAEDTNLWFLIGVYLGDGYRRASRHEIIFCVGPSDGVLATRVRHALVGLGLTSVFEDRYGGAGNVKLRVHARHLSTIMGEFGDGATAKRIPETLMGIEGRLLDALIDGYRVSDGSDRPTRRKDGKRFPAFWKIVSTSLPLLRSVQRLLLRRGEFGAIHVAAHAGKQTTMGRVVNIRDRWEIKVITDGTRRGVHDFADGAVWTRIRTITRRATTEPVWNMAVADDDTFCTPMIATHNCKGSSKLLSAELAQTEKYQNMNRLAGTFVRKMLLAWSEPPRLVIFENVPNITARAPDVIVEVTELLEAAGYRVHSEFHECGEIGGLAQKRKRFLMVARHEKRAAHLLYQPPKKRVRGCGEVLDTLPIPGGGAGGAMHTIPQVSWLTWVRLALIPAGGDWRDIPGVLAEGQPRRTKFRRHRVEQWGKPSCTIGGPGSNGPTAVADPRLTCTPRAGTYGVLHWTEAAATITASMQIDNGKAAVADPRVERAYDHGYAVLHWQEPSPTVAAGSHPGQGAYSVADPRGGVQGAFTVPSDPKKPPSSTPVIVAEDGTWHRPLTVLELAALQGFPAELRGEPLRFAGTATQWREHIGNAVPPPAAQAIAEKMLVTLLASDAHSFVLDGGGSVWVEAPDMIEPGTVRYATHHQEAHA